MSKNLYQFLMLVSAFYFCQIAAAEEFSEIKVHGQLTTASVHGLPPSSPTTFSELADSAFFSFSTMLTVRQKDNLELEASFFFWRSSAHVISVRAYVDGKYVGGADGVPTLIGQGRLAFTENGDWRTSDSLPSEPPTGYLLDHEPLSPFPEIQLSAVWLGKTTNYITVSFENLILTKSSSKISSIQTQTDKSN